MQFQPDFVITVGGNDITKRVVAWELNDVEDGISSLTVSYINPDQESPPDIDEEIELKFGYEGDLGGKVSMKIKERSGMFQMNGPSITITGRDDMENATRCSGRGRFKTPDAVEALKALGNAISLQIETGKIQTCSFEEGQHPLMPNEQFYHTMKRLLGECKNTGKAGAGKASSAKGGKAIKKQKAPQKPDKLAGSVGLGRMLAPGPVFDAVDERFGSGTAKSAVSNFLVNLNKAASSVSQRASLELLGVSSLQAKKCLDVAGCDEDSNGTWYIKTLSQVWNCHSGYRTRCDLIRSDADDQPMVLYADIYEKGKAYAGPRKIDAESQGTFTYGKDDKKIINFKWTETVIDSAAAGENVSAEQAPDDRGVQGGDDEELQTEEVSD